MRQHGNTLYVTTQGAYLSRDHETLKVRIEGQTRLRVPMHHLSGIVCFGRVSVSPGVIATLGEHGMSMIYLTEQGRFLARIEPPLQGNVLLRREQYRMADDADRSLRIARPIVAAKIQNTRGLLVRGAREAETDSRRTDLSAAAGRLAALLLEVGRVTEMNELRGMEGAAAREYFGAMNNLIRHPQDFFLLDGRSRRPPLDPVNAMLSFTYAILRHDCESAAQTVGLDPAVGFLHADRPGRSSLALDLMEEFRAAVADRLVLTLINRKQVSPTGFQIDPGGAVSMDDKTRKVLLAAYQERKSQSIQHPILKESVTIGLLPHIQARLLARTIRGELEEYPALLLR